MSDWRSLLLHDVRARRFFVAHSQSAMGTGAAYVALVVLALQRGGSAWAVALVLLAEFLPGMFLGPLLGAAADRWSRRRCVVAADLLRAAAFGGMLVVPGLAGIAALAAVAGIGTALFNPALLSSLPHLFGRRRLDPATALHGAITNASVTLGPALAAAGLAIAGPRVVLGLNGATFMLSALVLSRIELGCNRDAAPHGSLVASAREGFRYVRRDRTIGTLLTTATAVVICAGMWNVAEPGLARHSIGTSVAGYALLVAAAGAGYVAGALHAPRASGASARLRGLLIAMALLAASSLGSSMAPALPVGCITFAVGGYGNGLFVIHQRLLIIHHAPQALHGRVFGTSDTATAWGFVTAFAAAAGLLALMTPQALFLAIGGVLILVTVWAAARLWQGGAATRGAIATQPASAGA